MKRELIETINSDNYHDDITDHLKQVIIRASLERLQAKGLLDELLNELCLNIVMHQKGDGEVHFRWRGERYNKENGEDGNG